ncbi:MAG: error-prone DNA polymerase [Planctomycetota bacterium]
MNGFHEHYVELRCHSCFSFLEGASTPEDLVQRASALDYPALACTDRDGLYGAVRFFKAAKDARLKPIFGADLTLEGGANLLLLARTAEGYRNLCSILTEGRRRSPKGSSAVPFHTVITHAAGLIALSGNRDGEIPRALLEGRASDAAEAAGRYREVFGKDNFFLEIQNHLLPDEARLRALMELFGRQQGIACVATNDVRYATSDRRALYDVLTCIREQTTLDRAAPRLLPNGEYALRPAARMVALFRDHPGAVERTVEIASRCEADLERLGYHFPRFPVPPGETPFSYLHRLTHEGARERYRPLHPAAARQLAHELDVIERCDLAGYFLIVWDIVRFCRDQGILCQGRGSAANSAVCYALGITAVDPVGLDLLFERFLSEERAGAPDIDIDIAHEDREAVIQYVYDRYGRDHVGMVCEFITYRGRSAARDVGKVLGFSKDQIERTVAAYAMRRVLAAPEQDLVTQAGLDKSSPRTRLFARLMEQIEGLPRHLSIHVGGMIVTADPLSEIVPIENATMPGRTVIQWDKDDVADLGMIKIDLLGLGMLTLLRNATRLIKTHERKELDLAHLPHGDPRVYDMLSRADTVGVFQVESRAQMNTLPRLKPRCFYDLVIEVALIRPGPIQGDMVHPYLRRRAGRERISYPHPCLRPILERTLGIPLFQEQGMKVAVAAAGFSPGQADELRRAMGHRRSHEAMRKLYGALLEGMQQRGIDARAAEVIITQLAAFADFGFAESHAASFALLVYASAYIKLYYAAVFYASILNAQPMGFYSPATLVGDARRHGVGILPIDACRSDWDCTLESGAVRIGLRYVRSLGKEAAERFLAARSLKPYDSLEDVARRGGLSRPQLENLAGLGAFARFGLSRRQALWQLQALTHESPGPLAEARLPEPQVPIPETSERDEAALDYFLAGLSARFQPLQFYRHKLAARGVLPAAALASAGAGTSVSIAGLVICRQMPPTARGMLFLTLEDETGIANIVITPAVRERCGALACTAPLLVVRGKLECADGVRNVLAEQIVALDPGEGSLDRGSAAGAHPSLSRDFH